MEDPKERRNLMEHVVDHRDRRDGHTFKTPGVKMGRNDPCPCGSGLKWKRCCLRTHPNGRYLAL